MNGIAPKIAGKWHAARSLLQFARYLRNYREFFEAYRAGTPLPPIRLRGGMTIRHTPEDDTVNLFREIFVDRCYTGGGFYRPAPGDTVLDLGANIGTFAVFLQWLAPGVRVHCFEPGPETRRRLEENIRSNGLEGAVTIHPFAVSDGPKVLELKPARLAAQRSLFASEFTGAGEASESVECIGLDRAVELAGVERVQLLKVDIEGAEIEAMGSASPATWARVERVAAEYHDRVRPGCRRLIYDVLSANGFRRITEPITSPLDGMGTVHATRD
jgi:FkbM family methyltransferase